jgi:ATP-dependent RNA helicase HrpB
VSPLAPLPIDPLIPEILARVRESRAVVVTAAPGAGKTTRVPPALAADGPVIVLQPRRVAARSIARRIAAEQAWTLGREVGWHVRFERQFGASTQVLLATEGILTARLQADPLLTEFRTVVLDEFHERTIHADLGISLARQAWFARADLRIVVMSATLDAGRVSAFLHDCPIVDVPGWIHPLDVRYSPGLGLSEAVAVARTETRGQILCFLPGAPEIDRAAADLDAVARGGAFEIVRLHGSLPSEAQDGAIASADHRRVILATNIAETSLTVPGVRTVIDSGLHKVARYDADRGIDSLQLERISQDSADQRAGRAGRLGPGLVIRLWNRSDRLRPHREAEIHRIDLSGPVLDVLTWGGDPRSLEWFEAPPAEALSAAFSLLEQLGAISGSAVTDLGRRMQRLPIHPRLSRILLEADGARDAALACAAISEGYGTDRSSGDRPTAASDLSVLIDRGLSTSAARVAAQLQALVSGGASRLAGERKLRNAVLTGYPDRVARRRAPGSPRFLLASGHGASLGSESAVRDAEYVVAIDVVAGKRGESSEARIRMASAVDAEWLKPTSRALEHFLDDRGVARAAERDYYGRIVVAERVLAPDPIEAGKLLASAYLARDVKPADTQLFRRIKFAGLTLDPATLVARASEGRRTLGEIDLAASLPWDVRQQLERLAPEAIRVPSGRTAPLDYQDDGSVTASVKLQELFGLADTPRVGPRHEPVLLVLLAPNGRPVQMTRDLRSFWERGYHDVRKELRGRYPKHPWPDDPWTAVPTARTTKRKR